MVGSGLSEVLSSGSAGGVSVACRPYLAGGTEEETVGKVRGGGGWSSLWWGVPRDLGVG